MIRIGLVHIRFEMLVFDMRPNCFEQVGDPFTVLGTDRDRIAKAKAIGFVSALVPGPAFGLVRHHDHRRRFGTQPAADLLVHRSDPFTHVNQEQRRVRLTDRRFRLLPHSAGQRMRFLILEPGCVDQPEFKSEQGSFALTPVAGDAWPIVDQRQALADEAVEQRRFTDVRPADNRDSGQRHGEATSGSTPLLRGYL